MIMQRLDLKKELKHLYNPSPKKPVIIEVPKMNFIMIDGEGDPNTSQMFQDAIQTLFPLSYTLKFKVKKDMEIDYPVMALEGLWWGTPKGLTKFTSDDKAQWFWTLMMMQPDIITPDLVEIAIAEVRKNKDPPLLDNVRFESFEEGLVVQQMHIGPFDDEWKTVEPMHAWTEEQGYKLTGKHHEIYLSDMRRTAPEKLKTVLRHPIKKA
jgi:hypothetical protein